MFLNLRLFVQPMVSYDQQIKEMEDQLRKAQYNKHTEHHFGVVKAQIAKLRERAQKRQGIGTSSAGFAVKKSGDATAIILGFPSVGKSTLLNALTGAQSKVAAYSFTTLNVIPGVLQYKHASIQILDVPGIIQGAASGRGRGREVLSIMRNSDVIMMVIEALHPENYQALLGEVYEAGVRLNQKPPDVRIAKRSKGGVILNSTVKMTKVSPETCIAIMREMRINNADVVIRQDITMDEFIDAIEGNRVYIPSVLVVSKADLLDASAKAELQKTLKPDVFVSCETKQGIAELKESLHKSMGFMRVFLKEINKKPDLDVPMILRSPVTLRSVCEHIHRDFVRKFRYARLWGKSAKFPGQQFRQLDKAIHDGDIVELHIS